MLAVSESPLSPERRPGLRLEGLNLVVGLGVTGLSVVRALHTMGARVEVADSRSTPPLAAALRSELPDVACHQGAFDCALFKSASRLIVSPGVSVKAPAIEAAALSGVPVWGDIELFARLCRAPVVAITGSNGKSTVTAMIGAMACESGIGVAVGGNFGVPALQLLDPGVELYVLELSSFQLETTMSLSPEAAVMLNVSADHMDRYTDIDEYAQAKQRVYRQAKHRIFNKDDSYYDALAVDPDRDLCFTLAEPNTGEFGRRSADGRRWLAVADELWLATDQLSVPGAHNQANALAALALGSAIGLPRASMLAALKAFRGLPHRTELVATVRGVRWYNDSKGTNVGATVAAVRGLTGPIVLIAGGDGKDQDFTPLSQILDDKLRALIVLGRDAPALAVLAPAGLPCRHAEDLPQAVRLAADLAQPGDTVLLSPACASFDMFRNFEHRGEVFAAAVRELAA